MADWLKLHFVGPFELEANDSPKLPIVKTLNNPINIFQLIKTSFYVSFIKYLWISKILLVSIVISKQKGYGLI